MASKLAAILSGNYTAVRRKAVSKVASAVNKQNYCNPNALKPIGITVPIERPSLFVEPKEILEKKLVSRDQWLIVKAFLSKHPHYKFNKKVHSKWTNLTRYWFLDTSRNVKIVATYRDMQEELNLARKTSIRAKLIKHKEQKQTEVFIPTKKDTLTKYGKYLLQKYGTTKPFPKVFLPEIDTFDYKEPESYYNVKKTKIEEHKKLVAKIVGR